MNITGGFSPERELARLSEKGSPGRLEAVSVELEKLPRTKPNTHRVTSIKNPQISQTHKPKIFITTIVEHFGVSTTGETKVALNLREIKIDVDVVHKMGFSIDPHDRHTYRHRNDRPTAPTTGQPEPTNPNPPEFHAQSSSSAVVPSNQMIMDVLFSLRGYITNRMDALDAQNQQNKYELHHLSSRLSSMDIDEDSSDPESSNIFSLGFLIVLHITPNEMGSILKTKSRISQSMLLSENNTVKKILGEIVKKIFAPDLGTVLMKTPISPKRRKEEYL
ncbi:hypothetical protein Lal_00032144 [Lupinus albus]|nr:hypothetical protein Lal_00032144 [Lupinus albus]